MVTFRAWVKYIDREPGLSQKGEGGQSYKYWKIKTMDVDTRRVYWFFDWSGSSEHWKAMKKYQDQVLYIEGYLNSMGKIGYSVMQRWALWDTHTNTPINPITERKGFVEVIERFLVRNEDM